MTSYNSSLSNTGSLTSQVYEVEIQKSDVFSNVANDDINRNELTTLFSCLVVEGTWIKIFIYDHKWIIEQIVYIGISFSPFISLTLLNTLNHVAQDGILLGVLSLLTSLLLSSYILILYFT